MSHVQLTNSDGTAGRRRAARSGLIRYLAVVVALSAPLEAGVIHTHAFQSETTSVLWMAALMWVPGSAAVLVRLSRHEGFSDVSLRLGGRAGRRALGWAVALPFLIGGTTYGGAWLTGLMGVRTPELGRWTGLVVALLVVNVLLCFGEELGWRGYLVPRLVEAGVPAPLLVSALIWGLWHVPLVYWGGLVEDSPSAAFSTLMLMGTATSLGYLLARLRTDTGSVWPPYVCHVVWNVLMQVGFPPWAAGAPTVVWLGEFGVLTVAALSVVAVLHRRRVCPAGPNLSPPADATRSRELTGLPSPRPRSDANADADADARVWAREHQVAVFLTLAFLLSWAAWPLVLLNPDSSPLLPFGPLLAALTVALLTGGGDAVRRLLGHLLRWRRSPRSYLLALGLPPAVTLTAFALTVAAGGDPASEGDASWLLVATTFLTTMVVVGLFEELGWRAYLLPRLLDRFNALGSAPLVGAIWALWHLPELLSDATHQRPPLPFLVSVLAQSVIFAWLYLSTDGSVPIVVISHAATNTAAQLVLPRFAGDDYLLGWWVCTALWVATAAAVVLLTRSNLSGVSRKGLQRAAGRPHPMGAEPGPTTAARRDRRAGPAAGGTLPSGLRPPPA